MNVNHAWICSWNQTELSIDSKTNCSRKQLAPLTALQLQLMPVGYQLPRIHQLQERRDTHRAMPLLYKVESRNENGLKKEGA